MSDKQPTASEQSTMGLYLQELRRIPQLSREEEQAFAALAAQGDREARRHLIQANLRFVILVAKRYRNRGVPLEDLVNEGNIGLLHAAERFDPDRGVRFVSYAVWWIRQAILKAIPENSHLIRVPRGCAGGSAAGLLAGQGTLSLDSLTMDGESGETRGTCLADRKTPGPEEALTGVASREQLGSLLAGLSDRETSILRDRFGLAGRKQSSLLEAGRKHGLSKERVRQIEKKALRRIRVSDCARQLKAYAN
jgi:RNA polymerase primary sigma factor